VNEYFRKLFSDLKFEYFILIDGKLRANRILFFLLWLTIFLNQSCHEKSLAPEFPQPTPRIQNVPFFFQKYYKEPLENPSTEEGINLGKALFFDKSLSLDNSISCSNCHKPEKAFTDGLPLAVGIYNKIGRRNTPGILNTAVQQKFFWDGRDTSLEQQSLHPIQDPNEMGLSLPELELKIKSNPIYPPLFGKAFGSKEVTSKKIGKALAQFERTLLTQNSKYDKFLKKEYNPTQEELKGMQLFFQHPEAGRIRGGNCGDCHLPQTLFGKPDQFSGFHNTGLTEISAQDIGLQAVTGNVSDFGKFKPPGLRNIALTGPYMHDGRFQSLEQVLDHYNSLDLFSKPNIDPLIQLGSNDRLRKSLSLTEAEKVLIIAFLNMLTDSSALVVP